MLTRQESLFRCSSYSPRNRMKGQWRGMMFFNSGHLLLVLFTTSCVSHALSINKRTKMVDPMIEAQKNKAIALWKNVCTRENVPDTVKDNVLSRLDECRVPPIFHAYCAKDKRSFATPSPERAEVGYAERNSVGSLSTTLSTYHQEAFFPYVGNEKKACEKVEDKLLKGNWAYCSSWTDRVVALVNKEAEMVGADVEVTYIHGMGFPIDKEEVTQDLITRPLSRGVVADCLHLSRTKKNKYAIVGSPGIGKSFSLVYALQQALLYNIKCVVVCFQKHGLALACIRQGNEVFVWKARCTYPFISNLCHDRTVLVLLDPLESGQGAEQYLHGECSLICTAAQNDHLSELGNDIPNYQRFLGPYTEAELSAALPFLLPRSVLWPINANKQVMYDALNFTKVVGMLPRYIRSKVDRKMRKVYIDSVIRRLEVHEKELKCALTEDGSPNILLWGSNRYDSTIFTVSAAGTLTKDRTLKVVGYDGQLVDDYGEQSIDFVSDYVREKLTSARKKL